MSVTLPFTLWNGETKYTFLEVVGKGAFSTVYRATVEGKEVAMKVCKRKFKASFLAEIELLNKVGHDSDHLLKGFAYFWGKINFYIVTNLVKNCVTLKGAVLKTFEDKLSVLKQLTSACYHLHTCSFAHLDIKPDNILVEKETLKVTLIDYGLSCFENERPKGGTANYLSPERVTKAVVRNLESDVYSLGLVFFFVFCRLTTIAVLELLENRPEEVSQKAFLDSYLRCPEKHKVFVEKVCELMAVDGLKPVVARMLDFDPEKRPSAKEVLQMISECQV